jgi:NhaA family Na+:H+ antiporter
MAKKPASQTQRSAVVAKLLSPVQAFIQTESASGVVLIAAGLIAFIWANSPFAERYFAILEIELGVGLGGWALQKPLILWVNDLLMAMFFFLVGLEIKRELMVGELAGWQRASLPVARRARHDRAGPDLRRDQPR